MTQGGCSGHEGAGRQQLGEAVRWARESPVCQWRAHAQHGGPGRSTSFSMNWLASTASHSTWLMPAPRGRSTGGDMCCSPVAEFMKEFPTSSTGPSRLAVLPTGGPWLQIR